jgi:hypothetical protein
MNKLRASPECDASYTSKVKANKCNTFESALFMGPAAGLPWERSHADAEQNFSSRGGLFEFRCQELVQHCNYQTLVFFHIALKWIA